MQRARVGLIGLAAVILLIGLASIVMRAVSRERPVTVAGAVSPSTAAPAELANSSEPLADLGVTAGSGNAAALAAPGSR